MQSPCGRQHVKDLARLGRGLERTLLVRTLLVRTGFEAAYTLEDVTDLLEAGPVASPDGD